MNYLHLHLIKKLLLTPLLLSLLSFSLALGQANLADSMALVAFYNSTNGNSWNSKTNWLSNQPLSTWYGVGMSNGRVANLFLASNNMEGPIPPEIGYLKGLRLLFLANNKLNGTLPNEIGNLPDLVSLYLVNNQLSGNIPASIKGLNRISEIYLGNNNFSGNIPAEIGDLPNLTILNITNNQLSGQLPTAIGNAPQLITLDLSFNRISGEIPQEIFRPINLKQIYLNDNQVGGTIHSDVGNAVALTGLYLQNNHLTGGIPSSIEYLDELLVLDLSGNDLYLPLPEELGGLDKLKVLYLNDNKLSDPIPAAIVDSGNLPRLTDLHLQNNFITGNIPSNIGNLTSLEELRLDQNNLSGVLPKSLGALPDLDYLTVNNNKLSGSVPPQITSATSLRYLTLNDNELENLPDLSGLPNLVGLYVQNNLLTFEDLEPNANFTNTFICSPQEAVNESYTIITTIGSAEMVSIQMSGINNEYQWTLDGVDVPNATEPTLILADIDQTDEGIYECKVTNKDVDNLTIMRNPIPLLLDVLPIEMLSFTAKPLEKKIDLKWVTASETNNDFFIVERSKNGIDFSPIGHVNGNGTTSSRSNYGYLDEQPFYGVSYYRLRQTDFDGSSSLSRVVAVELQESFPDQVYPNPAPIGDQITVGSKIEGKIKISLRNANGDIVYRTTLEGRGTYQSLQFTPKGIAPGIYFVHVESNVRKFTTKVTFF